jgi:DNA polymerase III subunit delta'
MAEVQERVDSRMFWPRGYRERYFWHAHAWTALTRDFDRLPHAVLFFGPEGLGKSALAWRLTRSLLCDAPLAGGEACEVCRSCQRFDAGTHPDVLHVAPLGDSDWIVVDQIREITRFSALRPHTAKRKVVLLEPAEAMNLNAANALLKILEEPPASSVLLLATPRVSRIPATIRSRCLPVPLRPPGAVDALSWLRAQDIDGAVAAMALDLAGGAPLRALDFVRSGDLDIHIDWIRDISSVQNGKKDPLGCAARWKERGAGRCLEWFQRYVVQLLKDNRAEKINGCSSEDLFRFLDVLSEAKTLSLGPMDQALLLEDILIRWSRLFQRVG